MALLQAFDKVSVYIDKKGGRDKFFRVTQYLIKLIVQIKTINIPERKKQYGIVLVSKISKELSRARRAMRFGDVFGNIVDIRDAYRAKYSSPGERYLNIIESWILMLCDFYDSLTWVYSMLDMNVDLVDYFSNVYWFLGLLISLFKMTRELLRNKLALQHYQLQVRYDNLHAEGVTPEDRKKILADHEVLKKRQKIVKLSLVKTLADTIHAADGLEIGLNNPYYTTFVMCCALTASITGAYINWIK